MLSFHIHNLAVTWGKSLKLLPPEVKFKALNAPNTILERLPRTTSWKGSSLLVRGMGGREGKGKGGERIEEWKLLLLE